MVSQATNKAQVAVNPHSKTGMRSYQVALKCVDQQQREEINRRIRKLEEQQLLLLSPQIVKKAEMLFGTNPKEGFFTRQLCKEVGKSPNIAESAFHWLYIAVKGKIDKEQKVQGLFFKVIQDSHTDIFFALYSLQDNRVDSTVSEKIVVRTFMFLPLPVNSVLRLF